MDAACVDAEAIDQVVDDVGGAEVSTHQEDAGVVVFGAQHLVGPGRDRAAEGAPRRAGLTGTRSARAR